MGLAGTAAAAMYALSSTKATLHSSTEQNSREPPRANRTAHSLEHPGPIIIGVGGASGSGKTSLGGLVAAELRRLHVDAGVTDLSCDSYYKTLPAGTDAATYNFDHPTALDWDLLVEHLESLRAGRAVSIPHYSFVKHQREESTTVVDGAQTDVIILDGIFVLVDPRVRALLDISVFTSEDPDVCLVRRLKRDLLERGRSVDGVIKQYLKFVRPGFQSFVLPTMQYADLIIPRAKENSIAIGLLARECARKVVQRLHSKVEAAGSREDEEADAMEGESTPVEGLASTPRAVEKSRESLRRSETPYSSYVIARESRA